jgi:hypothetical protein
MLYSLILNNSSEAILAILLLVWLGRKFNAWRKLRFHPKFKENKSVKLDFRSRHKLIKEMMKNEKARKKSMEKS